MRPIYLDNHATTPMDPRVIQAMGPYLGPCCGNASSPHFYGKEANAACDAARTVIADTLGVSPDEIVFTSGATEANNMALRSAELPPGRNELVVSAIEHSSILETARELEKRGACRLHVVPVGRSGIVDPDDVMDRVNDRTALVSVMQANNEIGTIQPVEEIARRVRARGALMHVDACQSFCKLPLVGGDYDMITMSAHKMRGPKGIGALYIRRGLNVNPLIFGGTQERGIRPGTLNVPGIVGMGEAAWLARSEWPHECRRLRQMRDRLYHILKYNLGDAVVANGAMDPRLPHNLNVTFVGVCPQSMRPELDEICATSGASACRSSTSGSHVLHAIGAPDNDVGTPVRIGIGSDTEMEEIEFVGGEMVRIALEMVGKGCVVPRKS